MDRLPGTAAPVPGVEDLVEIGRGGTGIVYRGRQVDLQRDVAVKVVHAGAADDAERRWRREVSALARVSNHPNIVTVYDGGTTADGRPYLVMPYVAGGTLADRLQHGPLPADEVVTIGTKLAGALQAAHEAGVLHRDVKPANVLLGPWGEPQLADFGIARLLDATATATASVHATVAYAAPEVLSGQPATPASDVYGLGATLHACVAGTAPFVARDGEAAVALALRVIADPPPDLRALGVDPALAEVIAAATAKDPAERIPTAAELARRLDTVGATAPATTAVIAPTEVVPQPRTEAVPVVAAWGATPAEPAWAEPAPAAATPTPGAGPRVPFWLVLLGLFALGALAVGLVLGALDDDREGDLAGDATEATVAPTTPGAPTTTAPPPTTAAEPATSADPAGTAVSYIEAIQRGDFEAAYAMTSPEFQEAQPFDGYVEFWSGFDEITFDGEPEVNGRGDKVTLRLVLDDHREDYRIDLVEGDDGTLLVDGPRPH